MLPTLRPARQKMSQTFFRGIKIFDTILYAKVAWEQVNPECILKCFKRSRIVDPAELTQSPPPSPTNDPEEDEFAVYFEELLNVPWEEHLAMDENLNWNSQPELWTHRHIVLKVWIRNRTRLLSTPPPPHQS